MKLLFLNTLGISVPWGAEDSGLLGRKEETAATGLTNGRGNESYGIYHRCTSGDEQVRRLITYFSGYLP